MKIFSVTLIMLFAFSQSGHAQTWGGKGIFHAGFTMQYPSIDGSITYLFEDDTWLLNQAPEVRKESLKEGKALFGVSMWYNQPVVSIMKNFSIGITPDLDAAVSATGQWPLEGSLATYVMVRYGLGSHKDSEKKFGIGYGIGPQFIAAILYGENFSYPSTNRISKYGPETGGFPMYTGIYVRPALLLDIYIGRLTLKFNYQIGKFSDPKAEGEVPDEHWHNTGFTIAFRFGPD